ncbi:hypothetical protein K458DRAFT_385850 [Lentithecium fluviatile CBS 122367]|uniref:Uncharacterized protein n=1 Tax=Lentithecium fluviatile CBS 122367 TaxID=1168545 RepID=A0A6G1J9D6_9PLEO|nr:hypothetical protein K458DRAFT_385850 [Lentithecium fluviatile CBS 122367]
MPTRSSLASKRGKPNRLIPQVNVDFTTRITPNMARSCLQKRAIAKSSQYINPYQSAYIGYQELDLNCLSINLVCLHISDPNARDLQFQPLHSTGSRYINNLLQQPDYADMFAYGSGSTPPPSGSDAGRDWNQPPTPSCVWPFNTSFERPLMSFAAQRNPDSEHYIVMDRAQGYVRTTVADAREYAEMCYAVFDLNGWRISWDPPLTLSRTSSEYVNWGTYDPQFIMVYDMQDQKRMEMDAHWDDTIFYDCESGRWKRRALKEGVKSP